MTGKVFRVAAEGLARERRIQLDPWREQDFSQGGGEAQGLAIDLCKGTDPGDQACPRPLAILRKSHQGQRKVSFLTESSKSSLCKRNAIIFMEAPGEVLKHTCQWGFGEGRIGPHGGREPEVPNGEASYERTGKSHTWGKGEVG